MPNPSLNSQAPNYTQNNSNLAEPPKNEIKDWFYGTEELLDALPKRWTRSLLYLLIGFTTIVLPWAMLSKVDETGTARGRIQPKGATQKLDSAVSGSVTAVKVKEGETVKAGQVLVELQSDILKTQLQEAQTRLEGLKNRLAQVQLLKNQLLLSINVTEKQNKSQELEKISQLNQAQQNLDARTSNYNLQKLEKQALVGQAQQQITAFDTDQKFAQGRLNIDDKQVARFSKLVSEGAVSANQVDQLKKEQQESERLYEKAQSDIKQSQLRLNEEQNRYQSTINQLVADIKQAKLRLEEQKNGYQTVVKSGQLAILKSQEQLKDLQRQISSEQSEISQTKTQITSLNLQLAQRTLRAPVDGTIFELPVTKPGSVVQPGQTVAQIAPKNIALVLKAEMPSQQSGFLKREMPVKIKFDAYPFQDYGILKGHVTWISPDSKIQETSQGKTENFELEITLNQPYIQTGNKRITLTPGQTATAEVIIRQRRIIDFILDPFKKLQKGGLEL